jgi:hypothetical protein
MAPAASRNASWVQLRLGAPAGPNANGDRNHIHVTYLPFAREARGEGLRIDLHQLPAPVAIDLMCHLFNSVINQVAKHIKKI